MKKSLSPLGTIWLIAKREILTISKTKATIITTALMVALIVGGLIAFKAFATDSEVAVGFDSSQVSSTDISAVEKALTDQGSEVKEHLYESRDALDKAVTEGEVDSGVIVQDNLLGVVGDEGADDAILQAVSTVNHANSLNALAEQLPNGTNDPALEALLSPAPTTVLNPPTEVEGSQTAVGFIVGFLLYLGIFGGGMAVAQGVVEEKSSRVVEVLLASVRPWQLLTGKVLGIGIASVIQVALYVAAGVITSRSLGLVQDLPFDVAAVGGWVLLWFLIGYCVYALIFAGLGALVSRQEDLGSTITLPMILVIIAYMIGVSIAPSDPDSPIVAVASFVPFTSPIVMPIRSAYGVVGPLEVWIAVAIGLITIPLMLAFTAKIYSNGIRRSGAKIKLRDALKG